MLLLSLGNYVFLRIDKQQKNSNATTDVKPKLLSMEGIICQDDNSEQLTDMLTSQTGMNCSEFFVGEDVRIGPCNMPIGAPDENGFQKRLKHACRKSCGFCGSTELDDEGVMKQQESSNATENRDPYYYGPGDIKGGMSKKLIVQNASQLDDLKYAKPSFVHSRPDSDHQDVIVDVISIGTETRPEYVSLYFTRLMMSYPLHLSCTIRDNACFFVILTAISSSANSLFR